MTNGKEDISKEVLIVHICILLKFHYFYTKVKDLIYVKDEMQQRMGVGKN